MILRLSAISRTTAAAVLLLMASWSPAGTAPLPDLSAPLPEGGEVTLRYQAFAAGAPVGEALVSVALGADGRYRVQGDARSNGWIKGFTKWRNRFSASGRYSGVEKEPAEFAYTESDRDKHRHVIVRDGTLQVTKNGRERPPRSSPSGPDVVSALFVQPHCQGDHVLHTGRHVYRLSRLERDPGGCRYAVVDDDDDSFEVELVLARRAGLVVPKKITVYAWLTGWVELMDSEVR
jgi:hypothetical protein